MTCEEKIRLTAEYSRKTLAFSEAVAELHLKVSGQTKEEFARFNRLAEDLRVAAEQARMALERHTAAHGC